MSTGLIVQARIDSATKREASVVLKALGLTESDAIRILFTKMAQDKAFPFESLTPNATTIAAMEEARKGELPYFNSVKDLMASLNAED